MIPWGTIKRCANMHKPEPRPYDIPSNWVKIRHIEQRKDGDYALLTDGFYAPLASLDERLYLEFCDERARQKAIGSPLASQKADLSTLGDSCPSHDAESSPNNNTEQSQDDTSTHNKENSSIEGQEK